jgi:MFS family permease
MKFAAPDLDWMKTARIVAGFLLIGWYCKLGHFIQMEGWQKDVPIVHWAALPSWAISPAWAWRWFWLPLVLAVLLLVQRRWALVTFAAGTAVAAAGLCTQVNFHNDATFVTSFWAALWLLSWCASAANDPATWWWPQRLAVAVVSLTFLGGFVGKLTADYWSGQAFYTLYFVKKNYFIYNWLKATFDVDTVRNIATAFSRGAILSEGVVALGFWLGVRWYAPVALAVMLGMVIISTPMLLSVMSALIGLLIAAWRMQPQSGRCAGSNLEHCSAAVQACGGRSTRVCKRSQHE